MRSSSPRLSEASSFHHVLLSLSDSSDGMRCILSDLSATELRKKFVKPYRKGNSIFLDNVVLPLAQTKTVQIVRTRNTSEVERTVLRDKTRRQIDELNRTSPSVVLISAGRGHDPEDIAECGEDVTAEYILGPPGHAASGFIAKVILHPWVLAIGTGLILAGLVTWLKWK
jgi:hypothetical protein